MAKPLNLIGQRFGNLEVLERAENNKKGNTQWLCKCDCGKTKIALGYDLTHGRTTTCGCAVNKKGVASSNRQDLVGKRFGHLTVTSLNEKRAKNGMLRWNCVCDCGNTVVAQGSNLKSGKAWHCGCQKSKHSNNFIDLTGQRFGMLEVIAEGDKVEYSTEWICKCDCGRIVKKLSCVLRRGKVTDCGCIKEAKKAKREAEKEEREKAGRAREQERLRKQRERQRLLENKPPIDKHGMSKTRLYREWRSMMARCKPQYHCHNVYYDKGITVCDEWMVFSVFKDWALANGYNDTLTLDRIDGNGNYEPSNCRWADWKVQQNNKCNNVNITIDGVTKTMKQWSEVYNIPYGTVKGRKKAGWDVSRWFDPVQDPHAPRKYRRKET